MTEPRRSLWGSLCEMVKSERYIIQPEDVLTLTEYELLQRARLREILCPWCDRPLTGSFYFFGTADG